MNCNRRLISKRNRPISRRSKQGSLSFILGTAGKSAIICAVRAAAASAAFFASAAICAFASAMASPAESEIVFAMCAAVASMSDADGPKGPVGAAVGGAGVEIMPKE